MQFPDRTALPGPEPDDQQQDRQQEHQHRETELPRQEAKERENQQGRQRQQACLHTHEKEQDDSGGKRREQEDRPRDRSGGAAARPGIAFRLLCGGTDQDTDGSGEGGQEKTADNHQVTGAHIHVADGSQEVRRFLIAVSFGIQPEGIAAGPLQQDDREKDKNPAAGGNQHRPATDPGTGEQEEQAQVHQPGRQPLQAAGAEPPGRAGVRAEQAGKHGPEQEAGAEQAGQQPGTGKPAQQKIRQETGGRKACQDEHADPFIPGDRMETAKLKQGEKAQPQAGGRRHADPGSRSFGLHGGFLLFIVFRNPM